MPYITSDAKQSSEMPSRSFETGSLIELLIIHEARWQSVGQTFVAQLTLFWENKISEAPSQLSVTNYSTYIALGKDVALEYYAQVKFRSLHREESLCCAHYGFSWKSRVVAGHGGAHL